MNPGTVSSVLAWRSPARGRARSKVDDHDVRRGQMVDITKSISASNAAGRSAGPGTCSAVPASCQLVARSPPVEEACAITLRRMRLTHGASPRVMRGAPEACSGVGKNPNAGSHCGCVCAKAPERRCDHA